MGKILPNNSCYSSFEDIQQPVVGCSGWQPPDIQAFWGCLKCLWELCADVASEKKNFFKCLLKQ
jgi:hypothetical protein